MKVLKPVTILASLTMSILVASGCSNGEQVATNQLDLNAELEAARQADEFCQWVTTFNENVNELSSDFVARKGEVSVGEYAELSQVYLDGANRLTAAGYTTIGDFSETMSKLYTALRESEENPEEIVQGESPSDIMIRVVTEVEKVKDDATLIESRCGVNLSGEIAPNNEVPQSES